MKTYQSTRQACYIGYITQAIINNLSPLLFVIFSRRFNLALEQLTLLISLNFIVQLLVDLAAAKFADRIGYRPLVCAAHFLAVGGLVALGTLPFVLPSPYAALVIATVLCAMGGGLLEVIVSPIVEALPIEEGKKGASMSFLHSFYCWGSVGVVLLSTLFLSVFSQDLWWVLPLAWALLPLANAVHFIYVPIRSLNEGNEHNNLPLRKLFGKKIFLLLFLLMLCAGASELAMSQWASFFAEAGLGVPKTVGDILGPCMFAVFMGLSRVFFGVKGGKLIMERAMLLCAGLCVGAYMLSALSPWPLLSLVGCSLCGLAVGIMWPGTLTLAAKYFPQGGTAMFAILALAGDMGCATGPGLVGLVSGAVEDASNGVKLWFITGDAATMALKTGLLCAVIFPLVLALGIALLRKTTAVKKKQQ